jgi:hypothetical protein
MASAQSGSAFNDDTACYTCCATPRQTGMKGCGYNSSLLRLPAHHLQEHLLSLRDACAPEQLGIDRAERGCASAYCSPTSDGVFVFSAKAANAQ